MENIAKQLNRIKSSLPKDVVLVAVSKTKPVEDILSAYRCGQRIFGENYAQELIVKAPSLPLDIQWHFIGHLQSNKVKQIIPFVSCIESVDSEKLLIEINKQACNNNLVIDCFLQFHIAEETSKFGFNWQEATDLLQGDNFTKMKNIRLRGVMAMATFTNDKEQVRTEFKKLKSYFDTLKETYFCHDEHFCHLCMGMSEDFDIALEEGSNMVRIGSAIFGKRIYNK